MGLDMYLEAEFYVGGWKHAPVEPKYGELVKLFGLTPAERSPSFTVTANVGYWRKANHIHKWFVDHVQNGEDNCQRSYVTREQLTELRDLCREVLKVAETREGEVYDGTLFAHGTVTRMTRKGRVITNPEAVAKLLPTKGGFCFGDTDYDQYYLGDCEDTEKMLTGLLDNPALNGCDFYYSASW